MSKDDRDLEEAVGRKRKSRAELAEKAARQRVGEAIAKRIRKSERGHMASVARRLGFSGPHISGIAAGTKSSGWILAFAYADLCLVSPVRLIAELLGEVPPSLDDRDPRIDAAGARMGANLELPAGKVLYKRLKEHADSVRAAASQMREDDVAHLSRHVSDMAGSLGRMADGLREKSADEILHDVRRIARENPTLFIAGSIAV